MRAFSPTLARLRLAAWIALFAIAFAAAAPSITRVWLPGADRSMLLAEVCLSDGRGLALLDASSTGTPADAPGGPTRMAGEDCPYCTLHAGVADLPPASASFDAVPALTADPPPRFLDSPRPLFAWSARHARGPPLAA